MHNRQGAQQESQIGQIDRLIQCKNTMDEKKRSYGQILKLDNGMGDLVRTKSSFSEYFCLLMFVSLCSLRKKDKNVKEERMLLPSTL